MQERNQPFCTGQASLYNVPRYVTTTVNCHPRLFCSNHNNINWKTISISDIERAEIEEFTDRTGADFWCQCVVTDLSRYQEIVRSRKAIVAIACELFHMLSNDAI